MAKTITRDAAISVTNRRIAVTIKDSVLNDACFDRVRIVLERVDNTIFAHLIPDANGVRGTLLPNGMRRIEQSQGELPFEPFQNVTAFWRKHEDKIVVFSTGPFLPVQGREKPSPKVVAIKKAIAELPVADSPSQSSIVHGSSLSAVLDRYRSAKEMLAFAQEELVNAAKAVAEAVLAQNDGIDKLSG